jgi:outer membrane protein assembly factor BamD (BamD/ComL family)
MKIFSSLNIFLTKFCQENCTQELHEKLVQKSCIENLYKKGNSKIESDIFSELK